MTKKRIPRRIKKRIKIAFGTPFYKIWLGRKGITIKFKSVKVESKTRKVRAVYTREMADELACHTGIDVVQEMERMLIEELRRQENEN